MKSRGAGKSGNLEAPEITGEAMIRCCWFRGKCYTDTMLSSVKSVRGNKAAQLFVTEFGDVTVYPVKQRREAYTALSKYFINRGIPEHLHADNALELTKAKNWKKVLDDEGGIRLTTTEPYSQKDAEREIRLTEGLTLRQMSWYGTPIQLWDFAIEFHAEVRSRMVRPGNVHLDGRPPRESMDGSTIDISEYVQFHWYEPIFYCLSLYGMDFRMNW